MLGDMLVRANSVCLPALSLSLLLVSGLAMLCCAVLRCAVLCCACMRSKESKEIQEGCPTNSIIVGNYYGLRRTEACDGLFCDGRIYRRCPPKWREIYTK